MFGWTKSRGFKKDEDEKESPAGSDTGLVAKGQLQRYNAETEVFETLLKSATASVTASDTNKFDFELVIRDENGTTQVQQVLEDDMLVQFSRSAHSMIWVLRLSADSMFTLSFVFSDEAEEAQFKVLVATKLYEASRQEKFGKAVKKADEDWVFGANNEADYDAEPAEDNMDWSEDEDEDDEDDVKTPPRTPMRTKPTDEFKNSRLVVGCKNDRSFVLRGSAIGVFGHGDDDELTYRGSIHKVKDQRGSIFSPSKAMLHNGENRMLLLNPAQRESVYELDLETEKVVQTYQADDAYDVTELAPVNKHAQMDGEDIVVGLNQKSVFTLDPRLHSKNKRVSGYDYRSKPMMSVMASNTKGQYATGSETGEIRMYSALDKRAKTLLPGLGHAITHLEVSNDAKWLLATTAKYLLVVPVVLEDGRTGFDVSMGGAMKKPMPFKLQLRPQDLVRFGVTEVNFKAAHFDTGRGIDEQWIVSAMDNLIVTWNFKSVKRGNITDYTLKQVDESVVSGQFRFGRADEVVVTMPDDVVTARRYHSQRRRRRI